MLTPMANVVGCEENESLQGLVSKDFGKICRKLVTPAMRFNNIGHAGTDEFKHETVMGSIGTDHSKIVQHVIQMGPAGMAPWKGGYGPQYLKLMCMPNV